MKLGIPMLNWARRERGHHRERAVRGAVVLFAVYLGLSGSVKRSAMAAQLDAPVDAN